MKKKTILQCLWDLKHGQKMKIFFFEINPTSFKAIQQVLKPFKIFLS